VGQMTIFENSEGDHFAIFWNILG